MNNGILLYIDPGTGSMLFTILIGIIATLVFFYRSYGLSLSLSLAVAKPRPPQWRGYLM